MASYSQLSMGMRGEEVKRLQEMLKAAGFDPGAIDGIFGSRTEAAVRAYQQANNLQVDGIVGPQTWASLDAQKAATGGGEPPPSTGEPRPAWLGQGNAPPEEEQTGVGGVGYLEEGEDEATSLSILQSREMKWYFDRSSGKWYVEYGLPNSNRVLVFEARPDQMNALFGIGNRPRNYGIINNLRSWLAVRGRTFAGNIAEMEGTGYFEDEMERVIALALDEGILPDWLKDTASGAVYDLIYIAQSEGKSTDWLLEQISRLPEFKRRFPHIKTLQDLGMSLTESIGAFLEMEQGLKTLELQYGRDPARITPKRVGGLLAKGYNMNQIVEAYAVFDRLRDFGPALTAFNEILVASGREPIQGRNAIRFLRGMAPQETYDFYEASSIREAATAAGVGQFLSAAEAIDIALQTPENFTLGEATQYLSAAAQAILRMRHEIAIDKYDVSADDLIDLSLGIQPRSGQSIGEITENVERMLQEARAYIDQYRATPGIRVDEYGRPKASGLNPARPMS